MQSFKKMKVVLVAAVALVAFSAIAASYASATEPVWWVKGKVLKAKEEAPFESKQVAGSVQILKTAGLTIECTKEKDEGNLIGGKPGKGVTSATYTGCTTNGGCTVREPIELKKVRSTLVWKERTGGSVLELFEPSALTPTIFVEITLEKCTNKLLNGTFPVKGEVLAEVLNEKKELVHALAKPVETFKTGFLEFPCPPLKEYWTGDEEPGRKQHTTTSGEPVFKPLEFLKAAAEYCGKVEVFLASAGEFGVTNE